jgi:two-component system NtrC family response regulator
MSKPTILIVDDDEEIRTQMKWALADDYQVVMADDRLSALAQFKSSSPLVTLLDLGLPPKPNDPTEGMETLSNILELDDKAKVIIVSGQGEKENALQAVGGGAYDMLCKPVVMEELQMVLHRCVNLVSLEREYRELQESASPPQFEGMLARSPEMKSVFTMITKVAGSDAPVLVLGESGTGKEMVARAIHNQSPRADKPFVAINCSAIPENLIESELFGHEKGSFTGADQRRQGIIESADGGTLFLDEIGDLPAPIQVKLLRFLQDSRFQRVGGREELEVDTRLVTATNANLKSAIAEGTFREDLFFRIAVVVVTLPPLRDRGDDIGDLAKEFLDRFSKQQGKEGLTFAPDALRAIYAHTWPGNVRELENRVQRATIMADGSRVSLQDMELGHGSGVPSGMKLRKAREELERAMVEESLKRNNGKVTAAAKELGVSRPTMYELIGKLGIKRD